MRLGSPNENRKLRSALIERFEQASTLLQTRRLTTPGGVVEGAKVHWVQLRSGEGIWAYFSPLRRGDSRSGCWFGTSLGDTADEKLVPAVEINLPTGEIRNIAGRVLLDGDGRLFLGHRGGLGGGRGGQYSVAEFAQKIRGFVLEEFERGKGAKPGAAFVIGEVEAPDLIERLYAYVQECVRLRTAKRHGEAEAAAMDDGDDKPSFNNEADQDGTGAGVARREITRLHGRVVNALQKLVPGAVNSRHNDMRPDLYVLRGKRMAMLFEVKASSDTQSWFTAIGQLVVYSAGAEPSPRRIFVCPADRKHPAFQLALRQLGISLVTFEIGKGREIRFEGLGAAMT